MLDRERDFRSDTVTLPTQSMREAMFRCTVGDDVLGEDPAMNELEAFAADLLRREAALFVPSGTFGNQCAILTHTHSGDEVVACETCHVVQHEVGAAALIARANVRAVPPHNGRHLELADILPRLREGQDIHYPRTALVCLEQATAMGEVYPMETMEEIHACCRSRDIRVHVDGARLFNAATALNIDPWRMAACCDSVSVCLSKGLCAPVGSLLVGDREFIARARKNRKLLGGGMRQAGFLAAAGLVALKEMRSRLAEDHENAQLLARLLSAIPGVVVTRTPAINMVFARFDAPLDHLQVEAALREKGMAVYPPEMGEYRFVTHLGIDAADVKALAREIARLVSVEGR